MIRSLTKPIEISVLSTANPRFMSMSARKETEEEDDYLQALKDNAVDHPTDYKAFLKLGNALCEEKDYKDAVLSYRKAV